MNQIKSKNKDNRQVPEFALRADDPTALPALKNYAKLQTSAEAVARAEEIVRQFQAYCGLQAVKGTE